MDIIDTRKSVATDKFKDNKYWKKLKGIKNIKILAVIFIIAVALIIYSSVLTKQQMKGENTSIGKITMDDEEQRLAAILSSIEGAGAVETMITRRGDIIVGVLVTAEGADSITVRFKLLDATTTALSVEKSIVEVYKKK